jgi:hypothetical protein
MFGFHSHRLESAMTLQHTNAGHRAQMGSQITQMGPQITQMESQIRLMGAGSRARGADGTNQREEGAAGSLQIG